MMAPESVQIRGQEIPIQYRKNARAKRLTLRICPKSKVVQVTLPPRMSVRRAQGFIQSHEAWILDKLKSYESQGIPDEIVILGEVYSIQEDPLRKRGYLCEETQVVFLPKEEKPKALKTCLSRLAEERLTELCTRYAKALGVEISAVQVRDTKSRWGSCSTEGKIMLSWRLILAPAAVASYVVAHEICHRVHMNHSQAFWDLVGTLSPQYKTLRAWLKTHGNELFAVV